MTGAEISYIVIGATAGGFINGLAGFGTALFALGFFLTVTSPLEAVAITVAMSVASGLRGLWVVRHSMTKNLPRLARFLVPGICGIPLGVSALQLINVDMLKLVIAFFLILYGGYFSARSQLPKIAHRTPVVDVGIGFAGGFLGGAAALSGALPTMWCALRGWSKSEVRAVLQPYNMVILGLTGVTLAWNGAFDHRTLVFCAVAVPVSVLAAQIGLAVFHRLNDALFQRLLIAMTLVSGCVLMAREVFT